MAPRKLKFDIKDAKRGAAFTVQIVTRAEQDQIVSIKDDMTLKIRLTSDPGAAANDALLKFLAARLGIETSQLEIVAGGESSNKWISVQGVSPQEIEEKLQPDPDAAE